MLSTQAFNAFLKTLEEPPAYVIFILATTEKQKLLPTILSRCQIYDFDRMNVPNTVNHLKMVAEKEGFTYEEEALEIIAEKADGGMRDALSLFDQAASFCQGNITREKVVKDLNLMDIENYFHLVDLALENKCADTMVVLNNMLSEGIEAGRIVCGLAEHIRNVMMCKDPQTATLLEASKRYTEKYTTQAQKCPVGFIYKALQILNRADLNYRQSSNKRLLVEIALIEVAQITQPEDADGSPRKGLRLKSLFKNLLAPGKETVKQVAGKEAGTPSPLTSSTPPPAKQEHSVVKPDRSTKFNSSALGSTFGAIIKKKASNDSAEEAVPEDVGKKEFTEEDIAKEWQAMCKRMSKNPDTIGLAASMRNLSLKISNYPEVEIVVTNSILLEQLKGIKGRIRATLAKALENTELEVSLRIAENFEIKKVLSKPEILEKMIEKSSGLKKLMQSLHLELQP